MPDQRPSPRRGGGPDADASPSCVRIEIRAERPELVEAALDLAPMSRGKSAVLRPPSATSGRRPGAARAMASALARGLVAARSGRCRQLPRCRHAVRLRFLRRVARLRSPPAPSLDIIDLCAPPQSHPCEAQATARLVPPSWTASPGPATACGRARDHIVERLLFLEGVRIGIAQKRGVLRARRACGAAAMSRRERRTPPRPVLRRGRAEVVAKDLAAQGRRSRRSSGAPSCRSLGQPGSPCSFAPNADACGTVRRRHRSGTKRWLAWRGRAASDRVEVEVGQDVARSSRRTFLAFPSRWSRTRSRRPPIVAPRARGISTQLIRPSGMQRSRAERSRSARSTRGPRNPASASSTKIARRRRTAFRLALADRGTGSKSLCPTTIGVVLHRLERAIGIAARSATNAALRDPPGELFRRRSESRCGRSTLPSRRTMPDLPNETASLSRSPPRSPALLVAASARDAGATRRFRVVTKYYWARRIQALTSRREMSDAGTRSRRLPDAGPAISGRAACSRGGVAPCPPDAGAPRSPAAGCVRAARTSRSRRSRRRRRRARVTTGRASG